MVHRRIGLAPLGAILVIGAVLINCAFYFNWFQDLFAGGGRTVHAIFRDAGQLYDGDNVRVDGQIDGTVTDVSLLRSGDGSNVTLTLTGDTPPLYANASVALKWRTLLGGAFYVALDPGTAKAGPLGDKTITNTSTQVELDDVLGIIRGNAKQGLQTLPAQLADTFSDPDVPAGTLSRLTAASPSLAAGLRAVQGEDPDSDLAAVINHANAVAQALDQPDQQLQGLVQGAAATLQTTGRRDQDVEEILSQGPLVTEQLRTTLGSVNTTLTDADGLIGRLDRSAASVGPTLAALHPTLVTAAAVLGEARPLVHALKPAVLSLVKTSYVGVPLLDTLQPSLERIADVILPYLAKKDPGTGYSTTVMIGGTAAGFDGAASEMDQNGHYIRFPATLGTKSVYLPCESDIVDKQATSALACDDLQTALQNYLGYFPELGTTSATKESQR
jgi:phospholipid/cholesterol/gamma-HCH transport system substrate-binding protein